MQIESPMLFVEVSQTYCIITAGKHDENQKFVILEKIFLQMEEINKDKFFNSEETIKLLKENIEIIEKKINYIFREVTVILDVYNYFCLNLSGSKKLNGSQVLKENISYILNSLKLTILDFEKEKTILHIFNSKSILDGNKIDTLPIGLFGDFYIHELSFFLMNNNDLKNIKQVFNKNNLKVSKIILKDFCEGAQLINQYKEESFFKIKIDKDNSNICFFDQSSFRFSESFEFGTEIIFKDIEKICSIKKETILNFLSEFLKGDALFEQNEFLEKKYFNNDKYRKIRKKLIFDVAKARIEEIMDIILKKNINIRLFTKDYPKIYIVINDEIVSDNFKDFISLYFSKNNFLRNQVINNLGVDDRIANVANLSIYGWKKEAIPITQNPKSIISRIFNSIFG